MKTYTILGLLLCTHLVTAGVTDTLQAPIKAVTLYEQGAQINRSATVTFKSGTHTIVIDSVDRRLYMESLQVGTSNKAVKIMSVNVSAGKTGSLDTDTKLLRLERKKLTDSITLQKSYLSVYDEEKSMLLANKTIKGQEHLKSTDLTTYAEAYRARLFDIENSRLKTTRYITSLEMSLSKVDKKISRINMQNAKRLKTITIQYEASEDITAQLTASYAIPSAGWKVAYDLRVDDLGETVDWVTKAAISQTSDLDWTDIELTLSTGQPLTSLAFPTLNNYYLTPHNYVSNTGKLAVSGKVVEARNRQPLIGANVNYLGNQQVITDIDGTFSLNSIYSPIEVNVAYTGYQAKRLVLKPGKNIISLQEGQLLSEVVITGYNTGQARRSSKEEQATTRDLEIPLSINKNVIRREIKLDRLVSLSKTGNKDWITLYTDELPVKMQYLIVPKKEQAAFIQLTVADAYQYDLMDASVNIYFQGKYQGKYDLIVSDLDKDLTLVVGRDDRIKVDRTLVNDFQDRKRFGKKTKVTKHWVTTVLNGCDQEVDFEIVDQVPISKSDRIKVKVNDIGNGALDETTGEVIWSKTIAVNKSISVHCHYEVESYRADRVIVD